MRQKTAAIIVIGNEILTGKSEEQNARYLIGELYGLGVALRRVVFIPDDVEEIARTARECAEKFDYVFTSGGVGPTHDDVTISGIARAFDRPLVRHPELAALIRGYCGADVDETRLGMADAPAGAQLIHGEGLRWPVLAVENVYVLPGVPEYFRRKFEAIRERFRAAPFYVSVVYTLEEEFDLALRLKHVTTLHAEVEIGSYPEFSNPEYRVKLTLESKRETAVAAARAALLELLDPARVVRVE